LRFEYSLSRLLAKTVNKAQEIAAPIVSRFPKKACEPNSQPFQSPRMTRKTPKKEIRMPMVARMVTSFRKNREEARRTKIGEVAMMRDEFEAVVMVSPTAKSKRLRKVPKEAKPTNQKRCRIETHLSLSRLTKIGIRIVAEMVVLMAEKLNGETSRSAILAKRKSVPQMKTAINT
jgi:hypothetical protein